jgi:hypothetical protein
MTTRELLINIVKYPHSIDYLLFKYGRKLEYLPPLPISAVSADKYAKYVANYSDMLFIRRCLSYTYTANDVALIQHDDKYLNWFIQSTVSSRWRDAELALNAYRELPDKAREDPNVCKQYNAEMMSQTTYKLDYYTHRLANTISEIPYDKSTIDYITHPGQYWANNFVIFYWNKAVDDQLNYLDGKFLPETVRLSIIITDCVHYMYGINRGTNSWAGAMHKNYIICNRWHMVKIGQLDKDVRVIHDVSHKYIHAPKYQPAVFIKRPSRAYNDVIIKN